MHQTFPKPKPRVLDKVEKRKSQEQAKREAYRLVDIRDGFKCRACGRRCVQTMELQPNRLERHHLVFRSLGGKFHSSNLVTLDYWCHSLAQRHELIITGNADQVLTFEKDGRIWHS